MLGTVLNSVFGVLIEKRKFEVKARPWLRSGGIELTELTHFRQSSN